MTPFLKYTVLRLGLFLVALVTISMLGADPLLAVLLAALVSMLLSYVLLRGPRDELAGVIQDRVARRTGAAGPEGTGQAGGRPSAAARLRAEDELIEDELIEDRLRSGRTDEAAPGEQRPGRPPSGQGEPGGEQ